MIDIAYVKSVLGRKFRGSSIDDLQGISDYTLFREAAANVLGEIDPRETQRRKDLFIFKDVFEYTPEADLKKLIDIGPQVGRTHADNYSGSHIEEFNRTHKEREVVVAFEDGNKILKLARSQGVSQLIDACNALSTWAAAGGATNLALDTFLAFSGASFMFDVGATGGYLQKTDYNEDLSDFEDESSWFVRVYLPDASLVTSITLTWGDSITANWSRTVTAPHVGSFRDGWNVVRFDWNGATETLTPDAATFNFLRFTIVTTSADTNLRIDDIQLRKGILNDITYYSRFLFRDTDGVFLEIPTADDDILNLENDAENIFINECCVLAADGLTRAEDAAKYTNELYGTNQKAGLYSRYKSSKPAEPIRPRTVLRPIRAIREGGGVHYKRK